jgi:uncharacterized membrane protein
MSTSVIKFSPVGVRKLRVHMTERHVWFLNIPCSTPPLSQQKICLIVWTDIFPLSFTLNTVCDWNLFSSVVLFNNKNNIPSFVLLNHRASAADTVAGFFGQNLRLCSWKYDTSSLQHVQQIWWKNVPLSPFELSTSSWQKCSKTLTCSLQPIWPVLTAARAYSILVKLIGWCVNFRLRISGTV